MEVNARSGRGLNPNTNIGTERQLISTAAWKGDQPTLLDISGQTLWSWKVHCTSVKSNGGKSTRKFEDFIANPSGHRPSRRLKTCNSTKNYKLNNTPIETHQNIYLVGFYGQQLQQNGLLHSLKTLLTSESKVRPCGSPGATASSDDGYCASCSEQLYTIYLKVTSYISSQWN